MTTTKEQAEKLYTDAKQTAKEKATDAKETANDLKNSAQETSNDAKKYAQENINNAKETLKKSTPKVDDLKLDPDHHAKHGKGPIGSTIDAAERAATKAASIAVDGVAAAEEAAHKVSDKAKKASESAKETAKNIAEKLKKFSVAENILARQNARFLYTMPFARFNRRLAVPVGTSILGANVLLRYITNY
ncbi:hypothetical protein DV452_002210 [Geotrichum candidum]|nr:hypothetical protein DV452_002210 [Geotrichum candidum]KAI9213042.1 hypothetical protein DS838_002095 [Geotrichum bryndzae]